MLEIQKKLLTLLKEIDVICRKNNITWFMMYGTLLGAVRHKGFIPWDDDADIVFTHENWIKFKEACAKEIPSGRKLTSLDIDATQYGQMMARYHDTTQELLLKYNTVFTEETGIYIDIFILDYYPDNEILQQQYNLLLLDSLELAQKRYSPSLYLTGVSRYRKIIFKFMFGNRKKQLAKYMAKLATLGQDSSSSQYIQRNCIDHKYPKYLLEEVEYVLFEDTKLPIPKHFFEVLCIQYGPDWVNIPQKILVHDNNILTSKVTEIGRAHV